MVIPLLANQDLTPMLLVIIHNHYWQESFDGDSFVSPIKFDAYASRNISGRNPLMVIPLLANQDLTPMLLRPRPYRS